MCLQCLFNKGESSSLVKEEYPALAEFACSESTGFWAEGYFVQTVGTIDQAAVAGSSHQKIP